MSTLDDIKARAEKATPGPWKLWGMRVLADPVGDSNLETALPIADTTDPHRGLRTFNASFIAEARTDVPKLVAALEAVNRTLTGWEGTFSSDHPYHVVARYLTANIRREIEEALA